MSDKEQWTALLSMKRLGRTGDPGFSDRTRTEFDRDFDRIVFSSAFRRLKDKTQVFPLSKNDFTRTRLTHSLEVACVGRSLGRKVSDYLASRGELPDERIDIGGLLGAACLAHDIGNPPFGHSGEAAIQAWANKHVGVGGSQVASSVRAHPSRASHAIGLSVTLSSAQEAQDLYDFEGNAEALRVLTRLQLGRRTGGLQLTLATVGAMMKYPCGSLVGGKLRNEKIIEQKKFGYFLDDADLVCTGLREMGMIEYAPSAFRRHPLAFLVETADDVCYAVIDLEDSVDQRVIPLSTAIKLLEPLASRVETYEDSGYTGHSRLQWLRAYAITALINECFAAFASNLPAILEGTFSASLVDSSDASDEYDAVKNEVKATAYKDSRVLAVELAGFRVISGLLDIFASALLEPASKYNRKVLERFPISYLGQPDRDADKLNVLHGLTPYQRLLAATDYVSGMTDSFAVNMFQELSGIKLPE